MTKFETNIKHWKELLEKKHGKKLHDKRTKVGKAYVIMEELLDLKEKRKQLELEIEKKQIEWSDAKYMFYMINKG